MNPPEINAFHPVEQASLSGLNSYIHLITSPLVLLNEAGETLCANEQGESFLRNAQWEISYIGESSENPVQAIVQRVLSTQTPLWINDQDHLIHVTILSVSQRNVTSWEWIPQTQQSEQRFHLLKEVSQAVNSSLILEDIFESLGEVLQRYIAHDEATIVILDNSQNGIKMLVKLSVEGDLEISGEHHTFAGYEPVVSAILAQPQAYLNLTDKFPASALFPDNIQSSLVVPLVNKGVVIGLIALSSYQAHHFNAETEQLLSEVSSPLAVAVENAKFYWQTQAQAGREFLINQLTRSIRQSLEIDVILGTAVAELGKVLGVSRCYIRYFSQNSEPKAFQYRLPGTPDFDFSKAWNEQAVFQLRKDQPYNPFILNDVRDCPSVLSDALQIEGGQMKSLAIVPVLMREELAATITLHQCDTYRSWVTEDIELLQALSEHLGVALHQAQLFSELDQQKQALEQTLEELQQAQLYLIQSEKMAVLGQFVAGIAHEVNTPLGTIISNNATLKGCMDKLKAEFHAERPELPNSVEALPPPSRASQLFQSAEGLLSINKLATDRIQDIVKNLRNFARLDESELKTVDLTDGIESTILLVKSSLDPRIELVRDYDPEAPPLKCYPGLLNQVFMNLIVNASHALAESNGTNGQPTGQLERPKSITIRTRYLPEQGQMAVSIEDTGKGIAPEHLNKIFDPGFTTKGAGVGTGLGLALCYRIVEKHQGRIEVESVINQGTRFTVWLPLTP